MAGSAVPLFAAAGFLAELSVTVAIAVSPHLPQRLLGAGTTAIDLANGATLPMEQNCSCADADRVGSAAVCLSCLEH